MLAEFRRKKCARSCPAPDHQRREARGRRGFPLSRCAGIDSVTKQLMKTRPEMDMLPMKFCLKIRSLFLGATLAASAAMAANPPGSQSELGTHPEAPKSWGDWPLWGDQRDGTYRNPVLPADYSDLDCI